MLRWWYGAGWGWVSGLIKSGLRQINRVFAVSILCKTWFSPWKQITSTTPHQTFFQRLADNTISRLIGFVIRTAILVVALAWTIISVGSGVILVIVWPLLPISPVMLLLLFLSGVSVV